MNTLFPVALGILTVNVPFGFWRAGTRRFSIPWFMAVHLPIPLAVGLRLVSGLGWRLATIPLLVGAYVAGQYLGGVLRLRGPAWLRRSVKP